MSLSQQIRVWGWIEREILICLEVSQSLLARKLNALEQKCCFHKQCSSRTLLFTIFLSVEVRSNLRAGMDRAGNSNMFRGITQPSSSKTQCV